MKYHAGSELNYLALLFPLSAAWVSNKYRLLAYKGSVKSSNNQVPQMYTVFPSWIYYKHIFTLQSARNSKVVCNFNLIS